MKYDILYIYMIYIYNGITHNRGKPIQMKTNGEQYLEYSLHPLDIASFAGNFMHYKVVLSHDHARIPSLPQVGAAEDGTNMQ